MKIPDTLSFLIKTNKKNWMGLQASLHWSQTSQLLWPVKSKGFCPWISMLRVQHIEQEQRILSKASSSYQLFFPNFPGLQT